MNDKTISKYNSFRFTLIIAVLGATVIYADGSEPLYWFYRDDINGYPGVFSYDEAGNKYRHAPMSGKVMNIDYPNKDLLIRCKQVK